VSTAKHEIPPARAREIIELAQRVADKYCPTGKVDPETIIREQNIPLTYDHYADEFDGMLDFAEDQFHIYCNLDRESAKGTPRGRFTLAHELGHYFIEDHRLALVSGLVVPHPSFADRSSGDLLVEREADLFASYLLMPPTRFASATQRSRKGLSGVQDIARKFDVSLTCSAIRYVAEEVEESVLIKWPSKGRPWKWLSSSFRAANFGPIKSDPRGLPSDSATQMCMSMAGKRTGVIGKKIAASEWFCGPRTPQALLLREESTTLGRFGVLTLITGLQDAAPIWIRR
jgi:Zn-dependent peptidase ImmA (M78 family)